MISNQEFNRLTKQDVIEWFRERSDLDDCFSQVAGELSQQWGIKSHWPGMGQDTISLDTVRILVATSNLLEQDGLIYGINATIAEFLFNDRTKTGGAYNAKIQQIKQELERILLSINTTTTTENNSAAAEAA